MPGIRTSTTRHSGASSRVDPRNSAPPAKVCTSRSTERNRELSEFLTPGSSSTMYTIGRGFVMSERALQGERKKEHGAARGIGSGPQTSAMGFDDRAADGQSHAEAAGF